MSKFTKCLSVFAIIMIGLLTLASCNDSSEFYDEWYEAGATIEEDHVFELISVAKAVEMKEAGDDFIVFLGSSSNSTAVSDVTAIQYDADNLNYEGKIYFINTKDIISSISSMKDTSTKLGIKLESSTSGLIAICYKDGSQVFETSRPNVECERFEFDGNLSIRAVAAYAFEFYPVEE